MTPGQLQFDGLEDPFRLDVLWAGDLGGLVAGAPAPDGRGRDTLPDKYKTGDRRK